MLTRTYIRNTTFLIAMLCAVVFGFSQGAGGLQSNSILDISDLRPSNPDQFLKHIFVSDSTYTYAVDPESEDEWFLESRVTNTYDKQERLVGEVFSDFDGSAWTLKERHINAYDDENRLGVRQKLFWSAEALSWVNQERRIFEYNAMGLESQIVVQNWRNQEWTPSESTFKTYDLNGFINGNVHYLWNEEEMEWLAHMRTKYSYNAKMLLEEVLVQMWIDSAGSWLNSTRNTFEYNENDDLILSLFATWSPLEDDFVDKSFQTVVYNEKGQISSTKQVSLIGASQQDLFQESADYDTDGNLNLVLEVFWNEDAQEWSNYKRHVHFWSKRYTGNLDSRPDEITCVFENPHRTGDPWFCESLKRDVVYTLEMIDLLGRMHYRASFEGGSAFRIENDIPAGVYIAVIKGGLDVHSEKVVIR